MEPTVRLICHTTDPIETMYALWMASRTHEPVPSLNQIALKCAVDTEFHDEVLGVFKRCLQSKIPIVENISFTFLLEGVSVSFREQMVRHRVGVKIGEQLGVDLIPDLGSSSWWSQSMRTLDMGAFARELRYRMPESIVEADDETRFIFTRTMQSIEKAYNDMVSAGIPREDAREIIPLGATHRISWTLNMASLLHVIEKRLCWIAQLGVWEPIVFGMLREIESISPYFQSIAMPPCMDAEKRFSGCKFCVDNEHLRVGEGTDLPPCPLWLRSLSPSYEDPKLLEGAWRTISDGRSYADWMSPDTTRTQRMSSMQEKYSKLWSVDLGASGRIPIADFKGTATCTPEGAEEP